MFYVNLRFTSALHGVTDLQLVILKQKAHKLNKRAEGSYNFTQVRHQTRHI